MVEKQVFFQGTSGEVDVVAIGGSSTTFHAMLMSLKNGTYDFVRYDSGNPSSASGTLLKVERVSNRFTVAAIKACKVMKAQSITSLTGLTFTNYSAGAVIQSGIFTWDLFVAIPQ